jgi:pimeloyl-CoA dehydrogenase small subunit
MDFDLSDEQRMLQDSVERLMVQRCDFEQRKIQVAQPPGYSAELWAQCAEIGMTALPFAEADGGLGGSAVDTLIVMQAFGRALAPVPYLASVVLAGGVLKAAATLAQRAAWLPGIASGEQVWAFAHSETQARYDLADVATTATALPDGTWQLNGCKRFVLAGDHADHVVVSARVAGARTDRNGISLFVVPADASGLVRRGYTLQDRTRAADLDLNGVRVGAEAHVGAQQLPALAAIELATDTAIAALCAEAVGVMEQAHHLTVEYLKVRKQFGVPIGSFQALQHRAVDMLVAIEQARSMAYYAAMMCQEPDARRRGAALSAAKVQVGRSARLVGQEAIQLHGGIGMTEECQAGHYMRRLTVIEILFGDTGHHLRRLAASGALDAS